MKFIICFMLIITGFGCFAQSRNRYVVMQNNRYGYIDNSGKIVIKSKFRSASNFREGLAAVRVNGLYGYIDTYGKFVIKPHFDYAEDFSSGMARVYIDGKPFYINKKGSILFHHNYESIDSFAGNRALVKTKSGKAGFINRRGKLVIDTIFKSREEYDNEMMEPAFVFQNNRAVVERRRPESAIDKSSYTPLEKGIIDSNGIFIVPFGVYEKIDNIRNGFFYTRATYSRTKDGNYRDDESLININGNQCFSIPIDDWELATNDPHVYEGIAIIAIKLKVADSIAKRKDARNEYYYGAVDTFGHLIFSNKTWEDITCFDHNRAFAKRKDAKWVLINRSGKQIGSQAYDKICYNNYEHDDDEALFRNGIAFVSKDTMVGGIDTNGNLVIAPRRINFSYLHLLRKDNMLLFIKLNSSPPFLSTYGFWDTKTNTLLPPCNFIDFENIGDNIFEVVENDEDKYIDHYGKTIWKDDKYTDTLLNIDYLNSAYCYVRNDSARESDIQISENTKGLLLIFDTVKHTKWACPFKATPLYDARPLYVANMTNDTLFFSTEVGRISLVLQAKDKNGKWRDIEYLLHGWCGNAYYEQSLAPSQHWAFSSPIYHGAFKTKIRAVLESYRDSKDPGYPDHLKVYSQEIDGSINPAQFWRIRRYRAKEMIL